MLLSIELLQSGSSGTEISNEEKDPITQKTLNCPPASTSFINLYHNPQMKLALERSINFDFKRILPYSTNTQPKFDGKTRAVKGKGGLPTS